MASSASQVKQVPSLPSAFKNGVPIHRHPIALARRFFQICTAIVAEELAGTDIQPLQAAILSHLHEEPDIDQVGLAARIGIDRASTSQLVDQLVTAGLIERRISGEDRRARLLRLTRRGMKLRERTRPLGQAAQDHILAPLSRAERTVFIQQLVRIISEHEAYARPGAARRKPTAQSVSNPR